MLEELLLMGTLSRMGIGVILQPHHSCQRQEKKRQSF